MSDDLQSKWPNLKGGLAAATIIGAWGTTLVVLLSSDLNLQGLWWALPALLLQTFLYTGLFITAHDSMHGTVTPDYPRLNRVVGWAAVILYALFSFRKLRTLHWEHHRHPASQHDPDYHDGEHSGFWSWYLHFMKGYLSVGQILGMALVFNIMQHLLGVPVVNLLCFWVAPALLSTVQLFYFGTYLPHREPDGGYEDHHRAQTKDFHPAISFLTCYHFGYHWEHHERPDLPWWALPRFRQGAKWQQRSQSS